MYLLLNVICAVVFLFVPTKISDHCRVVSGIHYPNNVTNKQQQKPTHSSPSQALLIHIDEDWVVWCHQHVQPHVKLELCEQNKN